MTKILLSGCGGNMGVTVTKISNKFKNLKIIAGFDIKEGLQLSYPVFSDLSEIKKHPDVVIDFSHPSFVDKILKYSLHNKISAVICTTGLLQEHISSIKRASKEIPIFLSPNMSIGINLMIELVTKAAKILQDGYDIEIIEKHHNQKIDAPSGTALSIAGAISSVLNFNPEYVYNRHGFRKKRSKCEIGIHAVRGGTIVGDHDVVFAGTDEIIQISHSAASKEVFAVGAIKAAMFLKDKLPGMYNMKDLINEGVGP